MLTYISAFILWLSLSIVAGVVARSKGRSAVGYLFLSIFLSPLVGLIAIALLPPIQKAETATEKEKSSIAVFLIPIGLIALLGILLWNGLSLDPRRIPSPLIGKSLPAFSLPTVADPARKAGRDDLRGRVYLLNVWASWCVACRQEHPYLNELTSRKAVTVIGLNYKDKREDALQWLGSLGNPYEMSLSDTNGRLGMDLGVYGVPETFVIDKQGVIRYKQIGPLTPEAWETKIAPLIKELS